MSYSPLHCVYCYVNTYSPNQIQQLLIHTLDSLLQDPSVKQASDPPPTTDDYNPFAAEQKKDPEVYVVIINQVYTHTYSTVVFLLIVMIRVIYI